MIICPIIWVWGARCSSTIRQRIDIYNRFPTRSSLLHIWPQANDRPFGVRLHMFGFHKATYSTPLTSCTKAKLNSVLSRALRSCSLTLPSDIRLGALPKSSKLECPWKFLKEQQNFSQLQCLSSYHGFMFQCSLGYNAPTHFSGLLTPRTQPQLTYSASNFSSHNSFTALHAIP
jgi:hypothetical protein